MRQGGRKGGAGGEEGGERGGRIRPRVAAAERGRAQAVAAGWRGLNLGLREQDGGTRAYAAQRPVREQAHRCIAYSHSQPACVKRCCPPAGVLRASPAVGMSASTRSRGRREIWPSRQTIPSANVSLKTYVSA